MDRDLAYPADMDLSNHASVALGLGCGRIRGARFGVGP